jgi:hypothetical protein
MSLLPTTNYVKVISAVDPSRGWASDLGVLKLVPVAGAETFNIVSPCMAGQEEQSLVFRKAANPDLYVRHNKNFDMIITDNSVDAETFANDSCYRIEVSGCGVEGSVQFKSLSEESMYICSHEGLIQLKSGDPVENSAFSNVACWHLEPAEDIQASLEEAVDNDEGEELLETANRTISFTPEDQKLDIAFESSMPATGAEDNFTTGEGSISSTHDIEGSSGNTVVGSGGGFGAGGGDGTYGGSGLTEEMRKLILDDPGADLTSGNSGNFDFEEGGEFDLADGSEPSAVAKVTTKTAPLPREQGMSAVTIAVVVIGGIVVVAFLVFMVRKYGIAERLMGYFKRQG